MAATRNSTDANDKTFSRNVWRCGMRAATDIARYTLSKVARASGRKNSPAWVSSTRRLVRLNKRTHGMSSWILIC
jgi:hypothetical protein